MIGEGADPSVGWLDTHVHLWAPLEDPDARMIVPEVLQRAYVLPELERGVVGTPTTGVILIETGGSASDLALLRANAAASDLVVGFIAYAEPSGDGLEPLLDQLRDDPKFKGIRFRLEGTPPSHLDEPSVIRAARIVADRDLVAEFLVTTEHLPLLERVTQRLPGLRGIVDHLAKPNVRDPIEFEAWQLAVRSLADSTGLAMKLSVSPRATDLRWLAARGGGGWTSTDVRPYLLGSLACFGPDRVAWGSDWPVSALGASYRSVAEVVTGAIGPVSDVQARAIFSATARRIYRVPG